MDVACGKQLEGGERGRGRSSNMTILKYDNAPPPQDNSRLSMHFTIRPKKNVKNVTQFLCTNQIHHFKFTQLDQDSSSPHQVAIHSQKTSKKTSFFLGGGVERSACGRDTAVNERLSSQWLWFVRLSYRLDLSISCS
jgi:hypothetical protein